MQRILYRMHVVVCSFVPIYLVSFLGLFIDQSLYIEVCCIDYKCLLLSVKYEIYTKACQLDAGCYLTTYTGWLVRALLTQFRSYHALKESQHTRKCSVINMVCYMVHM